MYGQVLILELLLLLPRLAFLNTSEFKPKGKSAIVETDGDTCWELTDLRNACRFLNFGSNFTIRVSFDNVSIKRTSVRSISASSLSLVNASCQIKCLDCTSNINSYYKFTTANFSHRSVPDSLFSPSLGIRKYHFNIIVRAIFHPELYTPVNETPRGEMTVGCKLKLSNNDILEFNSSRSHYMLHPLNGQEVRIKPVVKDAEQLCFVMTPSLEYFQVKKNPYVKYFVRPKNNYSTVNLSYSLKNDPMKQVIADDQPILDPEWKARLPAAFLPESNSLVCLPAGVAPLSVARATVRVTIPTWPAGGVSATWHSPSLAASFRNFSVVVPPNEGSVTRAHSALVLAKSLPVVDRELLPTQLAPCTVRYTCAYTCNESHIPITGNNIRVISENTTSRIIFEFIISKAFDGEEYTFYTECGVPDSHIGVLSYSFTHTLPPRAPLENPRVIPGMVMHDNTTHKKRLFIESLSFERSRGILTGFDWTLHQNQLVPQLCEPSTAHTALVRNPRAQAQAVSLASANLPMWIEVAERNPGHSSSSSSDSDQVICIDGASTRGAGANRSLAPRCTQISSPAASSISLAHSFLLISAAESAALFYEVTTPAAWVGHSCTRSNVASLRASARYLLCASNDAQCNKLEELRQSEEVQSVSEMLRSNRSLAGQLKNVPIPRGRYLYFTFSLLPASDSSTSGQQPDAIFERMVTTGLQRVTCLLALSDANTNATDLHIAAITASLESPNLQLEERNGFSISRPAFGTRVRLSYCSRDAAPVQLVQLLPSRFTVAISYPDSPNSPLFTREVVLNPTEPELFTLDAITLDATFFTMSANCVINIQAQFCTHNICEWRNLTPLNCTINLDKRTFLFQPLIFICALVLLVLVICLLFSWAYCCVRLMRMVYEYRYRKFTAPHPMNGSLNNSTHRSPSEMVPMSDYQTTNYLETLQRDSGYTENGGTSDQAYNSASNHSRESSLNRKLSPNVTNQSPRSNRDSARCIGRTEPLAERNSEHSATESEVAEPLFQNDELIESQRTSIDANANNEDNVNENPTPRAAPSSLLSSVIANSNRYLTSPPAHSQAAQRAPQRATAGTTISPPPTALENSPPMNPTSQASSPPMNTMNQSDQRDQQTAALPLNSNGNAAAVPAVHTPAPAAVARPITRVPVRSGYVTVIPASSNRTPR